MIPTGAIRCHVCNAPILYYTSITRCYTHDYYYCKDHEDCSRGHSEPPPAEPKKLLSVIEVVQKFGGFHA